MASLARLIVTMSMTSSQWMPQPCRTHSYHQLNQLSLIRIPNSKSHRRFRGARRKAQALIGPIQLRLAASQASPSRQPKALPQSHLLEAIYQRQTVKSRAMRARLPTHQANQQVSAARYAPLERHSSSGLYSRAMKELTLGRTNAEACKVATFAARNAETGFVTKLHIAYRLWAYLSSTVLTIVTGASMVQREDSEFEKTTQRDTSTISTRARPCFRDEFIQ